MTDNGNDWVKVWVDTQSGTFGDIDSLKIVDVPKTMMDLWETGQASDSEISEFGLVYGLRPEGIRD